MPFEAPKPRFAAAVGQIPRAIEEAPVGEPRPAELRAAVFEAGAAQPPLGSTAFRVGAVAMRAPAFGVAHGDVFKYNDLESSERVSGVGISLQMPGSTPDLHCISGV